MHIQSGTLFYLRATLKGSNKSLCDSGFLMLNIMAHTNLNFLILIVEALYKLLC